MSWEGGGGGGLTILTLLYNVEEVQDCAFLFQGQETSYLTHPVETQSSVSFTASPSYYEGIKKILT